MGTGMSLETRRELLEQLKERYRWANRTERSRILDDFTASTDYARKHAIVLLNGSRTVPTVQPSRKRKYDEQVRQALTQLWHVANGICSKRLVPFLPELIKSMERHGHLALPEEVRSKLLTISPATMDRLLKQEREKSRKSHSATRPGSLLKKQIRVRTFADWDEEFARVLRGRPGCPLWRQHGWFALAYSSPGGYHYRLDRVCSLVATKRGGRDRRAPRRLQETALSSAGSGHGQR